MTSCEIVVLPAPDGPTSAMYGRVFFAALTLVASLATALVYGFGGVLAAQGSLGVGTVVA